MEDESEMIEVLQSIRWLFLDKVQIDKCPLVHGDFAPIPSLRSLAFQSLVLNCWPVDQFLPGEGYQDHDQDLRLLTRDCEGDYQMTSLEESFIFNDGSKGTEDAKKNVRAEELTIPGILRVVKTSAKDWVIGGLYEFSPAGCLRHVFGIEKGCFSKITDQEWIEGSSLVSHRNMEWDYSKEETDVFYSEDDNSEVEEESGAEKMNDRDVDDENSSVEEKFGVDSRTVVTFHQGRFLYKERAVNTRKCKTCTNCSYVYSVEAWFSKI